MSPAPRVMTRSPGRARSASDLRGGAEAVDVGDVLRRQRYGARDEVAGHLGVGVLAGDVDVEHDDLVGGTERDAHRLAEDAGARDEVRLEGRDHAAVAGQRTRGLEVAADLDGVVGVGVVDADAGRLALELHPATGAGEAGRGPSASASKGKPSCRPMASAATASRT